MRVSALSSVPPAPDVFSASRGSGKYAQSALGLGRRHNSSPVEFNHGGGSSQSALPVNWLIDRVERLERLFASELQIALDTCKNLANRTSENDEPIASTLSPIMDRMDGLEVCLHDLQGQLQQRSAEECKAPCLTELDWVALHEQLDERFNAQIERASQRQVETEKVIKAWQDRVKTKIAMLEKRLSEQQAKDARFAEHEEHLEFVKCHVPKLFQKMSAMEEQLKNFEISSDANHARAASDMEVLQQVVYSQVQALECRTQDDFALKVGSFKKELQEEINILRRIVNDSRSQGCELEKRLNTSSAEVASGLKRQDVLSVITDLRSDVFGRVELVKESLEQKLEQMASEFPTTLSAFGKRLHECESSKDILKRGLDNLEHSLEHKIEPITSMRKRLNDFDVNRDSLKQNFERRITEVGEKAEQWFNQALANASTLEARICSLEAPDLGAAAQARWEHSFLQLQSDLNKTIETSRTSTDFLLNDLRKATSLWKEDIEHQTKDLRASCTGGAKQVEHVVEEMRIIQERIRTTQAAVEDMQKVTQRRNSQLDDMKEHLETLPSTLKQQRDGAAETFRCEIQAKFEVMEGKLNTSVQDLQSQSSSIRKQVDRAALEMQDARNMMSKQVQSAVEESRGIAARLASLTQETREATAAAESAERRCQGMDAHVNATLETCEQQMGRSVSELQKEIAAMSHAGKRQCESIAEESQASLSNLLKQMDRGMTELRTEVGATTEAIRQQLGREAEDFHSSNASLSKRVEGLESDFASSEERRRNAARSAEEVSKTAHHAEKRSASLEERVETLVDRCRAAERIARDAGTEAKTYADAVAKRLSHNFEDLQGSVNSIAKHARSAIEDARSADERVVAIAKNAQETLLRVEETAARKPEVNVNDVSRQHFDRAVADLRLEAKHGLDNLGKEMTSTVAELRGTVNSLSLQMECGLSGNTAILGDVVESAAQKHLEHLEWLKALDGHRSIMEKQQAELEERLSAMLRSHKVSFGADLEAVGLRLEEHDRFRASIAEIDTGVAKVHVDIGSLRNSISSLEMQLKSRLDEFEAVSDSLGDRMNSLQSEVAENRNNVMSIVGAFSTAYNS